MFYKIKNYQNKIPWSSLRDLRTIGQIAFIVIVLLTTWSGAKSIQTNYDLQKQISELKQENAIAQLKDNNLALQNQYYNTSQFLDINARQELGLGLPGETELLIPKNVSLAQLSQQAIPKPAVTTKPTSHQSWYAKNFESWMDFFLHRPQPTN